MRDRQTCIGCGKKSPETETNYTLISAQFGWRLTRYKDTDGSVVIEWRCPTCWREYKKAKGADAIPPSGFLPEHRASDPASSQPRQATRAPYPSRPPEPSAPSIGSVRTAPRPAPSSTPPPAKSDPFRRPPR